MRHYTEADLLETRFTKPGESMPVMMHLAECEECAARWERLEQKMGHRECHHPKAAKSRAPRWLIGLAVLAAVVVAVFTCS